MIWDHRPPPASPANLLVAHQTFRTSQIEFGISEIAPIENITGGQSFLLSDRDRNWWEIAYLEN